jgi:hypothetical protein
MEIGVTASKEETNVPTTTYVKKKWLGTWGEMNITEKWKKFLKKYIHHAKSANDLVLLFHYKGNFNAIHVWP